MSPAPKSRRDNYVVLQGYMVEEMGLTDKELIAYAVVYGFAQAGSPCEVSMRYFQFWLGCTRATAQNTIKSLESNGYIERRVRFINGVQFNSFVLGPNAIALKPFSPEVLEVDEALEKPQENTLHSFYTGRLDSMHPVNVENDNRRSETRIKTMQGESKTGGAHDNSLPYIANTDSDSKAGQSKKTILDSESDTASDCMADDGLVDDFNALRGYLPNTDGFSFGLENYRKLRGSGHSASSIAGAAYELTEQLHRDYPERTAKFFPHAEKLLDPKNPSGVMRYLKKRSRAGKPEQAYVEPDNWELFMFALTSGGGQLSREAAGLNEAIANATCDADKNRLLEARAAWVDENRGEIMEAWREKQRYRRRY